MAHGKAHKQATPKQMAELRVRLSGLEETNANVLRYRWLTNDRVLHRFITARNGNVDVALRMLLDHLVRNFKFSRILKTWKSKVLVVVRIVFNTIAVVVVVSSVKGKGWI